MLVVLAAADVEKTFAATYVVGDSLGWTIPSGGASTYSNWASQHTFRVGDTLGTIKRKIKFLQHIFVTGTLDPQNRFFSNFS